MNLMEYEFKHVILESTSGNTYEGTVGDYIFPEDNENGKESIVLDAEGEKYPLEFYEEDIRSIRIVDDAD